MASVRLIKKNKFAKNSAKNLIIDLVINQPDQVWISDFTYLFYQNKFMYLATILDAFTREVIAWNISSRHSEELVMQALLNAINKREKSPNIFHFYQGSEYKRDDLAKILRSINIKASHHFGYQICSRKGLFGMLFKKFKSRRSFKRSRNSR